MIFPPPRASMRAPKPWQSSHVALRLTSITSSQCCHREIFGRVAMGHARRIDEDADRAILPLDVLDQIRDTADMRQIIANGEAPLPPRLDRGLRLWAFTRPLHGDDLRARPRQRDGNRRANPPARPRHHRPLPIQPERRIPLVHPHPSQTHGASPRAVA